MKHTLILFCSYLLCSCATLLNTDTTIVNVYSDQPTTITQNGNTFKSDSLVSAKMSVMRSNKPLILKVKTDSTEKDIIMKPKLDIRYYHNWIFYGIGYLVDLRNNKRFTYTEKTYLDRKLNVYKRMPTRKGDIYFDLSFPSVNFFSFMPIRSDGRSERRNRNGFFGIAGGIDYYYKKNQFISFSGGAVIDHEVPVPVGVCYDSYGEFERMHSVYLSLTHNHRFRKFSFAYGLSYSCNVWRYENRYLLTNVENDIFWIREPEVHKIETNINYALGLDFNARYFTSNNFNIGIGYRPSFYRFSPVNEFQYEHLIYLNFGVKIKLIKGI